MAIRVVLVQDCLRARRAGVAAVLLRAALVVFLFPRKDEVKQLLTQYHLADTAGSSR